MDNLFELLILMVFILSGINSLFGNKKKRREKMEKAKNKQSQSGNSPEMTQKQQNKNVDLLEELFGIKKESDDAPDPFDEPEPVLKPKTQSKYENYDATWNPEDDFQDKNEIKYKEKQKIFDEISKIDYDKKIPKKDSLVDYSKIKKEIIPEKNSKALELIELLKNKNSVKNSILAAEILGKPKALRFRESNFFK